MYLSKLGIVLSCIGSALALTAGPAFPGSSASNVQAVSTTLSSATSSSAYKAKHADESAAIARAISSGSKALTEAVASDMAVDSLKTDAFIAAHLAVRKMVHTGGCPRTYTGCPVGWVRDNMFCAPGVSYTGICGAQNLDSFSVAQKENFSYICGVSWACADASSSSFDSDCPASWGRTQTGCVAPASYTGICSPTTDMTGWSAEHKARWSAMCGAPF